MKTWRLRHIVDGNFHSRWQEMEFPAETSKDEVIHQYMLQVIKTQFVGLDNPSGVTFEFEIQEKK